MIIIGIGGSDHNVSSCLLEDGELKVYIEEERLSKEKHGNGVKSSMLKSVDYCLEYMGLKYEDVDYFVYELTIIWLIWLVHTIFPDLIRRLYLFLTARVVLYLISMWKP